MVNLIWYTVNFIVLTEIGSITYLNFLPHLFMVQNYGQTDYKISMRSKEFLWPIINPLKKLLVNVWDSKNIACDIVGVLISKHLQAKWMLNFIISVANSSSLCLLIQKFYLILTLTSMHQWLYGHNLYYSAVYPHINYGIVVWGNSSSLHAYKMRAFQKCFMKMFSQNAVKYTYTGKMFSYDSIYEYFTCVKFYKCYNQGIHSYFTEKNCKLCTY